MLWTYVGLLHVLVLVLVVKTNFWFLAGKTLGLTPPAEWTEPYYEQVLRQAKLDMRVPPGRVILVGDSIVAQLNAASIGPDAVNFGIGGDTTHTLLGRLPVLRSIQHGRAVVLEIGVNDLKYRPVEQIARDYRAVLDALAPAPLIIAVSVLPVDASGTAAHERPYLRNDRIAALNVAIKMDCLAHSGCQYLDAWPAMAQGGVYGRDGWHLSADGDQALGDLIRRALPAPL
jgi:lysophospholipase L1-like esterase